MTDESADNDQMRGALLPGRVGLFVRLSANPGGRTGLLDALHRYADRLALEPNTEAFVIALDPDDEDVVWLYEWFTDEAGLEAHRLSEPFVELVTEIPELLASPPGLLRIDPLRLHLQTAMLDDTVV
ncbi:MAG: antibiotic biosynthesis monooxygenase family protein [Candidatus Nanopelagicales bacterium]|jgi:quinol monooxygenase YgiN